MKRVMALVGLSVIVALSASIIAEAQSKKKGKEPELSISKRGNLLLEDDFSDKELLWTFDSNRCNWKVVNKTLATKSTGASDKVYVSRSFQPTEDIIVEMKMFLPIQSRGLIGASAFGDRGVQAHVIPSKKTFEIWNFIFQTCNDSVAVGPLSYQKPRWVQAAYEMIAGRYALTVDGKTIQWEQVPYEKGKRGVIKVFVWQSVEELAAIDDVKVYEALPKDEGNDKDDKGNKK
ncbi:MAG: hypothetical protein AB1696_18180 [Planctomycetota bacterium]